MGQGKQGEAWLSLAAGQAGNEIVRDSPGPSRRERLHLTSSSFQGVVAPTCSALPLSAWLDCHLILAFLFAPTQLWTPGPAYFQGSIKIYGKSLLAQSASLWEDSGFNAWGVDQLEGEFTLPLST